MRFAVRRIERDGFATAVTLLIILVLAVIGLGAAWLASTEKKTSFAESVHLTALYSADSGGEAAINFLRLLPSAPAYAGAHKMVRSQAQTALEGSQRYDYNCQFLNKGPAPAGWDTGYAEINFGVTAGGWASQQGRSAVGLVASRLFRTEAGYN
jgi:hypothetical protein